MSHILVVGQKYSSLIEYIEAHGHTYTLLQDELKTKYPNLKFKHRVVVSFSDKTALLNRVDRLKKRPDAVISVYENYVLPAAWIAEHLGVFGMPVDSAMRCTDKDLMRQAFALAPEKISPDFMVVTNEEDLKDFASKHKFPLIIKPANLAKSLLVTKNHNLDELLANYRKSMSLLDGIYKKYAASRTPKLLVEEFLQGSIHSVDAFIDAGGNPHVLDQIVDYKTGYDIGFEDNFHYSRVLPSKLSSEDRQSLKRCAEIAARSLGMKCSPAHIEVIMTPDGPRIVEIGARNGGYRERMHMLANGIDIMSAALDVFTGRQPEINATKNENVAVLELFPKTAGEYVGVNNEDKLRELPSLNNFIPKRKAGEQIGKAADGYKMTAIVILHNSDAEQFEKDLTYVTDNCQVITK